MYKSILIGYDGSKASERALSRAIELAKSYGANLHVVGVVRPLELGYLDYITPEDVEQFEKEEMSKEEKILGKVIQRIKENGLEVNYKILEGNPAEELMSYADQNGIELIVVGRKGAGMLKRILMGSTSTALVKYANQDVLVVI
ncbi:MAG: universal stress protein [Hydrogenothermaceae bacterium]|nr:universal stress protein [Hydrogenothermaceae bacterium]